MTLPAWPTTLPNKPLIAGTSIGALTQDPIRTEFEDGPMRMRRRSTATFTEIVLRFKLTNAQWAIFQDFNRDTLNHGASRFTMPVWRPDATAPYPTKTVEMTAQPASEIIPPDHVFVSLSLRVRDY